MFWLLLMRLPRWQAECIGLAYKNLFIPARSVNVIVKFNTYNKMNSTKRKKNNSTKRKKNKVWQHLVKFYCAKVLIPYGFPTFPLTKLNAVPSYCKNYPYLYIFETSLHTVEDEIELQIALVERNKQAVKLFSFYNLPFVLNGIFAALFLLFII